NAKAKAESLQQALTRLAASKKGQWASAVITDKDGWVKAWWPAEIQPAKEIKGDPFYSQMKSGALIPGISVRGWSKQAQQPALGKDGKPVTGAKVGFDSMITVACGIEDASQNFAGMVRVLLKSDSLFGLDPARSFKGIKELS